MKMKLCAAFVFVFVFVAVLAACGGGGGSDLPAGQHDLGGDLSVAVHEVRDPVENSGFDGHVVAVDLEYFNRSDQTVSMAMAFGAVLHDSDGREAEYVAVHNLREPGYTIPPHSTVRGWKAFRLTGDAKPAKLLLWGQDVGPDVKPTVVDL